MKPHVICHMVASVDGRTLSSRWRPKGVGQGLFERLHEAGMSKSTPDQILQRGADWRFLNELKREMKA